MSFSENYNNGKWRTVADLENAAANMENNLQNINKTFINKMLKVFNCLMVTVQHKEAGIFNVALKWFRLYLKVLMAINPDDKKLLKHFENTVPTIITYIIGCLQYKWKEMPNYHYDLLEILEELLANVRADVLNEITKFEIGTIGCLWNPIDLAGDFNTQSKALKILTILLKQFDGIRQNEELKCIKWTNLNLFQDKLKIIVQETQLTHVIENSTRELLNNYNMNLAKNVMVYSFYCTSAMLDNKYTFYKPLNLQKFWIDINYSPKTLSFRARFKLYPKNKYEDIIVILKIQIMKLQNNILLVYFKTPGDFSKYDKYFTNITDNVIQFNLGQEEVKRLKTNNYVMDYFNRLNETFNFKPIKTQKKDKNIFDLLKQDISANLQDNKPKRSSSNRISNKTKKTKYESYIDSSPEKVAKREGTSHFKNLPTENFNMDLIESPKTTRNKGNGMEKHPIRNLRNRKKFFTSMIVEDSDEEIINKNSHKRRTKSKKPRQTKSRCKQVCKVTPTVDLTKIDGIDTIKQNIENPLLEDITPKKCPPLLTTQDCNEVLKRVANIYEVADTTYAKPCQSYRNFELQPNTLKVKSRKKKVNKTDNESSVEKIRKLTNDCSMENKENINPQTFNKIQPLIKTNSIISPHLFDTQCSENSLPVNNNFRGILEENQQKIPENLQIDLTEDNYDKPIENNENSSCSDSMDCEEVRGLNEHSLKDLQYICTPTKSIIYNSSEVNTPRPTSCMNISDLNDSDMEITLLANNRNFAIELIENNHENNNPNFIAAQQNKDSSITQTDNDIANENLEVPICLQEILNDFEFNSDDNLDANTETPNKQINEIIKQSFNNDPMGRDYYKDCVIFQKRVDDAEVSDSSEDELQINSNQHNQQNCLFMQNRPLYLNQNRNHQNDIWSTPVKNDVISSNFTTTMATKCQVTPTAVIVEQIQVSAKKSVIFRNKKSRNVHKANKSLSSHFENVNADKQLVELKKDIILQKKNSNLNKKRTFDTNTALIYQKAPTNDNKKIVSCYCNKPKAPEMQQLQEHDENLVNLPVALSQQQHFHLRSRKQIINHAKYENPYETPSTNPATQTQYNDDMDNFFEQRSSPRNVTEESENSYFDSNGNSSSRFSTENSFKSDISQILDDFNTNFQLRLKNAQHKCLQNVSIFYKEKFCEIAQNILKKSQKHNNELEEIRFNIGRLVRELERQYDNYVNKSREFDIHKEIMEQLLESLTKSSVNSFINQEYEDLMQQLNFEQNKVVNEVWRKYVETQKKFI